MSRVKAGRRRLLHTLKDDSGVAVLVIAAVIAVVAFTALTIFLTKLMGDRELRRAQSAASGQARVLPAIFTYYLRDASGAGTAPHALPCPDTAATPTGKQTGTCTAAGNYVGVIPWVDLGLSKSDVIDSYGNFYTYVVSGEANGVCESITKSYSTTASTQEFTGKTVSSALEALLTSQTAGQGRKVPFAIIGHGRNGLGALTVGGALTSTPSATGEAANKASTGNSSPPSAIYTGPVDTTDASSTYFDDQVLVPSTMEIQKLCAQVTPGGEINASLSDSFDNATTTATNFGSTHPGVTLGATSSSDSRNKVASFDNSGSSYLATNATNFNFTPGIRPVYVSAKWIGTSSRMSIATRATAADLGASDDFTGHGITFRFASTGVDIRNDGSSLASSAAFSIVTGVAYIIEAYDDGSDVWARISREDDPSVTASARASNVTGDTGGEQRIFFINGTQASELDDITVGFPMLAMETTGADSYASSTGNGTSTGKLTLEAWVKPRSFPSADGAVIAKWDTSASTGNAFRLRIDSVGRVHLDAGRSAGQKTFDGPVISAKEWTHIAVTYDFTATSETVAFFKNGDLYSSMVTSGLSSFSGLNAGTPNFMVGADLNGAAVEDEFTGDISDVRVWKAARTAEQIHANFQARLTASANDQLLASPTADDLVVNWRLDLESGGLASSTTSATPSNKGTSGTLTSASYVPALARYFRPLSTSFCPSGTIAGAYECDFRTAGAYTINLPATIDRLYAKIWGGGGGSYNDSTNATRGGSGGFSQGRIRRIGTLALYDLDVNDNGTPASTADDYNLQIVVGGGGGSSTTTATGAGGGGASMIRASTGLVVSMGSGGGGGASYSAAVSGGASFVTTITNILTSDGLTPGQIATALTNLSGLTTSGIGAGGAGNGGGGATVTVNSRAPDSVTSCGGRDGNHTFSSPDPTPPSTDACSAGGQDPDTSGNGGGATSG